MISNRTAANGPIVPPSPAADARDAATRLVSAVIFRAVLEPLVEHLGPVAGVALDRVVDASLAVTKRTPA